MAKKTKLHPDDIELVATLVAKTLRDRGETDAPAVADYVLTPRHPNGSMGLEVHLKLTKAITINLVGHWWPDQDLAALVALAEEIADAATEARSDVPEIEWFIGEVAKEARRQVAKARRRGLRHRLLSVTPTDIEISAPRQPGAIMWIEMLNRALAAETGVFDIDDVDDVEPAFRNCEAEQRTRAEARALLEAEGATGAIDAVVLRALEQRGADVADVLARMHETDYILDVSLPGLDHKMPLYWDDGVVRSSIRLAEGITWREGCITFNSAPKGLSGKLAGKSVTKVFDHPYLSADTLVLRSHSAKPGGFAMVPCTDRLLRFDGRSGRVWEPN